MDLKISNVIHHFIVHYCSKTPLAIYFLFLLVLANPDTAMLFTLQVNQLLVLTATLVLRQYTYTR